MTDQRCLIRPDSFRIGGRDDDIIIDGFENSILVEGTDFYLKNLDASVLLNGKPAADDAGMINRGDVLSAGGLRMTFLTDRILIDNTGTGWKTSLPEVENKDIPFEGFPDYKRSPRIIKRVEDRKISIEKPKTSSAHRKVSLLELILPPVGMAAATVLVSVIMRRGLFILMALAGTGMSLIVSVMRYVTDKRDAKEERELNVNAYRNYLLGKRREIYKAYWAEKEAYDYNYPRLTEIQHMVDGYSPRIYERSSNDEDFLKIPMGWAEESPALKIDFKANEISTEKDPLEDEALDLQRQFSIIEKPVIIDLKETHLGLVGEKGIIHEQLKVMITNLIFFHSYNDLEIVVIYNKEYDHDFQWMRWFKHIRIHSINCVGLINSERKRDQILGSLHQILKERKIKEEDSKKSSMYLPHFLFIIDEPKWIMDHSIMEYLDKEGYNLGFSIVYTTHMRANLPENIKTIIDLKNSEEGVLLIENRDERNLKFRLQRVNGINLEWIARNLSTITHQQGISAQIPASITFFKMYGVDSPDKLGIEQRWVKNDPSKSLAVPIGVRAIDDNVNLDLHEKAHGPHGLVAGTTGSGKSETLQTYILSLAVNFSPYDVAFLLIDYKGGGMADLFRNLPHLLGTITNLDGEESMRAMASIKAELGRRQNIFNKYHVNHINSYGKLFRNGTAHEPMPHLFIISDEFAELKKEQPEFMKELVSAARIGRSLGVHLILATQKPTGVVDDQIWSNSRFKIALKVQNEADSKEILKTPDAANITETGRGYLQVGNNEIYELFQSAWSGASYNEEAGKDFVDDRVYLVNDLGQGVLINNDLGESTEDTRILKTQLDVTVEYIDKYYHTLNMEPVKRPWLPPLAERIENPLPLCDAHDKDMDLAIPVGLVDIPEEQAQKIYSVNLLKDGNLLYVAAAGFGKTVFLMNAAFSLAKQNSVCSMNMYILDFGNSGLIALKRLHHVSDYIAYDDKERFEKFFGIIEGEMEQRKKLFAASSVQSFEVYNQSAKYPSDRLKAIVILIDNMDVLKEDEYEVEQRIQKITRDSSGLGIYFIGTATRSGGVRYALLSNFRNKVCGYVVDESDISVIVGHTKMKQSETKGRAFVKYGDGVALMQMYTPVGFKDEIEFNTRIEELTDKINNFYPDEEAPAIPVLPETLDYDGLLQYIEKSNIEPADIYLGLDKEKVIPVGMDRDWTPFLILGEAKRGKTNALRIILNQAIGTGEIYLVDSKALDLYAYKEMDGVRYFGGEGIGDKFVQLIQEVIQSRNDSLRELLQENPNTNPREYFAKLTPVYLIVDDTDDFASYFNALVQNDVAKLLESAVTAGICAVFTANSGKFKGFDPISKVIKNTTNGLMVGSQGTSAVFPISNMQAMPEQKDGLLWHEGSYIRIRLPKAE